MNYTRTNPVLAPFSRAVIVCMIFGVLLCGCKSKCDYTFGQSSKNIDAIEIIYLSPYEDDPITELIKDAVVVTEVSAEQWDGLLSDYTQMPCHVQRFDPSLSVNGHVIRIIYNDGTFELISAFAGMYFDGQLWKSQSHIVDEASFLALLQRRGGGSSVSESE